MLSDHRNKKNKIRWLKKTTQHWAASKIMISVALWDPIIPTFNVSSSSSNNDEALEAGLLGVTLDDWETSVSGVSSPSDVPFATRLFLKKIYIINNLWSFVMSRFYNLCLHFRWL